MSEVRLYVDEDAGVFPDQRCSIGEKIRRLARFLRSVTAEEMVNRMEYL